MAAPAGRILWDSFAARLEALGGLEGRRLRSALLAVALDVGRTDVRQGSVVACLTVDPARRVERVALRSDGFVVERLARAEAAPHA